MRNSFQTSTKENNGAHEGLPSDRQRDKEEDRVRTVAVDEGRFLDLVWHALERRDREPDGRRECQQAVGDDERGARIVETDVEPDDDKRNGDRDRRKKPQRQYEKLDVAGEAHRISRDGVSQRKPKRGADQHRTSGYDDRVDEARAHTLALEHVKKIVECWSEK